MGQLAPLTKWGAAAAAVSAWLLCCPKRAGWNTEPCPAAPRQVEGVNGPGTCKKVTGREFCASRRRELRQTTPELLGMRFSCAPNTEELREICDDSRNSSTCVTRPKDRANRNRGRTLLLSGCLAKPLPPGGANRGGLTTLPTASRLASAKRHMLGTAPHGPTRVIDAMGRCSCGCERLATVLP